VNKERVREGDRKWWKRLYSSWRLVLYFEITISHLLSYTNTHSFMVCDTHTHTHTHTHRWISACLHKGKCETEVHVCYYFIIRSADAVRSQTHSHSHTHTHTHCVLRRRLWLFIPVSDSWVLASDNCISGSVQHSTSICSDSHAACLWTSHVTFWLVKSFVA